MLTLPGTTKLRLITCINIHSKRYQNKWLVSILQQLRWNLTEISQAEGTAKSSFLTTQLEANDRDGPEASVTLEDIKGAAGVMYCAGADTVSGNSSMILPYPDFSKTWSSLSIFFLAMILNPEHQARAQKEIDAVIGPDRLPEFEDRASLPYLECLLQETLRYAALISRLRSSLTAIKVEFCCPIRFEPSSIYVTILLTISKVFPTALWRMTSTTECLFQRAPS